jgi:hypothetical protein
MLAVKKDPRECSGQEPSGFSKMISDILIEIERKVTFR